MSELRMKLLHNCEREVLFHFYYDIIAGALNGWYKLKY